MTRPRRHAATESEVKRARASAITIVFGCATMLGALGCGGAAQTSTPAPTGEGTSAGDGASSADGASAAETSCLQTARATWKARPDAPESIRVRHLVVKFAGSKRADEKVTRTEGQACLRAMEARDKLRAGADFSAVVKEYSEEPGAASREGSLGEMKRADLVKAFADAAFSLDAGELSDVVETEFGFHVILRDP